jgi:hypothetical protein
VLAKAKASLGRNFYRYAALFLDKNSKNKHFHG